MKFSNAPRTIKFFVQGIYIYSTHVNDNTVKSLYMFGVDRNGPCYKQTCYKGTVLQRNYRKMTILWSFSYNSFLKFHINENLGATTCLCYIQIYVIMRCVIKGHYCILIYGPGHEKTCLWGMQNNKGSDQPAHHRLISGFVIRLLESIISKLVTGEISIF